MSFYYILKYTVKKLGGFSRNGQNRVLWERAYNAARGQSIETIVGAY